MKRSLIIATIFSLLFTGAAFAGWEDISPAEYQVFSGVLKAEFPSRVPSTVVVKDWTSCGGKIWTLEEVSRSFPEADEGTVKDFMVKNTLPQKIEPKICSNVEISFISEKEHELIFAEEGWPEFHDKFDALGMMTFSRVGFNQGRTQALLYYDYCKDSLKGSGYMVLLGFEKNQWRVVKFQKQ